MGERPFGKDNFQVKRISIFRFPKNVLGVGVDRKKRINNAEDESEQRIFLNKMNKCFCRFVSL
jgi:hypothetical protein